MPKQFGLLCPVDPSHGPLIPLVQSTAKGEGWYCPHQGHDGWKASPTSPPFVSTRPFFTTAQAEAAMPTGKRSA